MAIRSKTGFIAAAAFAALLAAAPAPAQLYLSTPDVRAAPIEPSDPLVGLPLPGATAAEPAAIAAAAAMKPVFILMNMKVPSSAGHACSMLSRGRLAIKLHAPCPS